MMIARFREVGLVAGCAAAALCCYLAAQRVASERLALGKVEREIARLTQDNMRLETEIATRSRTGQLERWNGALFRLGAPAPSQFFQDGVRLAAFVDGRLPHGGVPIAAPDAVRTVAYQPAAQAPATPVQVVRAPAMAPPAAMPAITPKAVQLVSVPAIPTQPLLHQANFVRAKPDRLSAAAAPIVKIALTTAPVRPVVRLAGILDDAPRAKPAKVTQALAPLDLGALAAAEGRTKKAKRSDENR